jgi:hypothetical protein
MSKITLAPSASGTGTLTVAAPNTNTDYTLTLPAETGTVLTNGGAIDVNASAPADSLAIDSSGNVGIGTSSPAVNLNVVGTTGIRAERSGGASITMVAGSSGEARLDTSIASRVFQVNSDASISINATSGVASGDVNIDSSGNLLVGMTTAAATNTGCYMSPNGFMSIGRASDASLMQFSSGGVIEGSISVSGTTVSYNGGHLSRWAQTIGPKDETLVKGTVLSNLDEMNVYTDAEGNPVDNEQLNKVKVSDVEGDANVAGVFVNWTYDEAHSVDEINMAMTGDMIIRIAQGVTVQRGDLLMSAGDGTAKPQEDDIVRSKTIAKVTSTNVTCTYEDGSYCVPCVLMAC